jgi:hypothetical protein
MPPSSSSSLAKQPFRTHSLPYKIMPRLSVPSSIRPSGFDFFGFRNNNYFTEQGRQPCVQHPTWRTRSLYLCPLATAGPSYIPRHRLLQLAGLRWSYSNLPLQGVCKYCHMIEWLLVIGFIEYLQIVTTSNYSAIANSHTLQFATARTTSQSTMSSPVVA